jgi:hypothetical protein
MDDWVAFLTSSEEVSCTSAVLVSKDPALGDPIPDARPCPGAPFVPGVRIQNSMFGRQFNRVTAYDIDKDLPLSELPARMNGPEKMCFGFQAELVGHGSVLGARPVGYFLPWCGIRATDRVRGNLDRQLSELLPAEPIGELFDDICTFGGNSTDRPDARALPGDVSDFQMRYVEIGVVDGGIKDLTKGSLNSLPKKAPIKKLITRGFAGSRRRFAPGHVCVPVVDIYCDMVGNVGPVPLTSPMPASELREIEAIVEINGPVGNAQWHSLYCLAWVRRAMRAKGEDFETALKDTRDKLEQEELAPPAEGDEDGANAVPQ